MRSKARSGVFTCRWPSSSLHCLAMAASSRSSGGDAITLHQLARLQRVRGLAEQEHHFRRGAGLELDTRAQRGAGVESGAGATRRTGVPDTSAAGASSVPWRPRNSRRSAVHSVCSPPRGPRRPRRGRRCSRDCARRSPVISSTSVIHMRRAHAARCAQHPLHVAGDREACGGAGLSLRIVSRQILMGSSVGTNMTSVSAMPCERCSKRVYPGAVRAAIVRVLVADGRGRRRPQFAGLLVAQVDSLAGPVADRVVAPGRERVVARVARPGVAAALRRRPGSRSRGSRSR